MSGNQLLGMLLNSHAEAGILGEIPPVSQRRVSFYLLNYQTCSPCTYHRKETTYFIKQFFVCLLCQTGHLPRPSNKTNSRLRWNCSLLTAQSHPALSFRKQVMCYRRKPFSTELPNQRWQKTTYLFSVTDTEKQKTDIGDFCIQNGSRALLFIPPIPCCTKSNAFCVNKRRTNECRKQEIREMQGRYLKCFWQSLASHLFFSPCPSPPPSQQLCMLFSSKSFTS